MATDFRFNAQNSYSPLLTALAEAPMNKAKLQIAQEQNSRQRLSDLLTNISSAASLSRNLQVMNAVKKLSEQAGGQNSPAGNAAMINPEGFAGTVGQLPATMLGLNTAFPSPTMPVQSQAPAPSLAGEGVTPDNQTPSMRPPQTLDGVPSNSPASNVPEIKNRFIMKTLFGEPQVFKGADGLSYSHYPGTNIPPTPLEPPRPIQTSSQPGEPLSPEQQKNVKETGDFLSSNIKDFRNDSSVKDAKAQIDSAKTLLTLNSVKIPVARLNSLAGQVRESGITRVTVAELGIAGIDPSVWERLKQNFETWSSGNFTNTNLDELKALGQVVKKIGEKKIQGAADSYSGNVMDARPDIEKQRVQRMFQREISPYLTAPYKPGIYRKGKGILPAGEEQKSEQNIDLGKSDSSLKGFSYSLNGNGK